MSQAPKENVSSLKLQAASRKLRVVRYPLGMLMETPVILPLLAAWDLWLAALSSSVGELVNRALHFRPGELFRLTC